MTRETSRIEQPDIFFNPKTKSNQTEHLPTTQYTNLTEAQQANNIISFSL